MAFSANRDPVCKICGMGPDETEFYSFPSRKRPEYCKACNSKATCRKRWARMHRKGKLDAVIKATIERLEVMETVRDKMNAGLHPVDW